MPGGEAFLDRVTSGNLFCRFGAGRRLSEGVLQRRDGRPSLSSGSRGAAHQAVQREGGPRLDHVDAPDGDQGARGSAGLLRVQREVTEEVAGPARP